jgi:hypothetical protein
MSNRLPLPAPARWASAATSGLFLAAVTYHWWHDVSPWLGFIIALDAATVADMIWVARNMVPLPHIAILIASLQYGLAPWASSLYPSTIPEYQIADLKEYLKYAGPALAAMALGFLVSGIGMHVRAPRFDRHPPTRQLLGELDLLLWGGIVISFLGSGVTGNYAFVVVLLGTLRFVGGIGWMITAAKGWKWRIGAMLFYEVYLATVAGMFHDLILWSLSLLAVYVYLRQIKRTVFVSVMVGLVFGVFFLQDAKWTLRAGIWEEGGEIIVFGKPMTYSDWERPFVTALCLVDSSTKLFTGGYSDESIADSITRFNQGWIIDRVMHHVPAEEPYARGETLWWALRASLLPRVLAPDKLVSDGKVNMERFAGHVMTGGTSMNLGFAGEMYANFGLWGGVAGCGFYALLLGLFFRWAAVLAQKSTFWWAIAVFCGHWAFKAETDIGSVTNYVVKSAVLIFVVTCAMPSLRGELLGRRPKIRRRKSDLRSRRTLVNDPIPAFENARPQSSIHSPVEAIRLASPATEGGIDAADSPFGTTGT